MTWLKERIRRLDRYQKGVMLVVAAMIIVFTVLYPVTILRVGFEYNDSTAANRYRNSGSLRRRDGSLGESGRALR